MTKTFTAAAVLQLAEQGKLRLDDPIGRYVPDVPYDKAITIRQLLTHTGGIPNPIPLRWVHPAEDTQFDDDAAYAHVLKDNPNLASQPGTKFAYSNIGYWILGKIVEKACGQDYRTYMRIHILKPLGMDAPGTDFVIHDFSTRAKGYLPTWSLTNLLLRFFADPGVFDANEGRWWTLKDLYVNGVGYSGLVGTARTASLFLQDQLQAESVLFDRDTKQLFYTQQTLTDGTPIPMTPGWHIGQLQGITFYYKDGGGGGFRSEMRIYPDRGIASVIIGNNADFDPGRISSDLDGVFLNSK
jgi:D-alanyl-D-alanine carboxypeptidase